MHRRTNSLRAPENNEEGSDHEYMVSAAADGAIDRRDGQRECAGCVCSLKSETFKM